MPKSIRHDTANLHQGSASAVIKYSDTKIYYLVKKVLGDFWLQSGTKLKSRVVAAIILLLLGKITTVYAPYALKNLIDGVAKGSEKFQGAFLDNFFTGGAEWISIPLLLVLSYGIAQALSVVFNQLRDIVFASAIHETVNRSTVETFKHILTLSAHFHTSRQTGAIARSIDSGAQGTETILRFLLSNSLPVLIEVLLVGGIFFYFFGFGYGLIIVAVVVLFSACTFAISNWRAKLRREMNTSASMAASVAVDSLTNFETAKYFGNELYEVGRFSKATTKYQAAAIKTSYSLGLLNIIQSIIFSTGLILLIFLVVREVQMGTMTIGAIVMMNTYLFQLNIPLNFIGTAYREIAQSSVDIERVYDLKSISSAEDINDNSLQDPANLKLDKTIVNFRNVYFNYAEGRENVLNDISFQISKGESVGLVGKTGSGKSTITRLLLRFYDPIAGTIEFNGRAISNITHRELRSLIGVVPQDVLLFNESIGYNLNYGLLSASKNQVIKAAQEASIHEFIESLPEKYNTIVGERGIKLSGGEKQRMAIARVLLKNPPLLVLDEATSSLDTITENAIQDTLGTIKKSRTALIIAHRLSTVTLCDKIIVMKSGKVIELGNHEQLLAKQGEYFSMWQQNKKNNSNNI